MLKKFISILILLTVCATHSACAPNKDLKSGEYVCKDSEEPVMFARLQLSEDGQFLLIPSMLSSFHGAGSYNIHGDMLLLDCFDDNQYTFIITDEGLVFDAENSSGNMGSPAGFSDGSVFLINDGEPFFESTE